MTDDGARAALTYSRYLKLDELLALQEPKSEGPEHDEMLFIVIHQVYELWFKQVGHELDLLKEIEITDDRAFELFGLALGHDIVAPTQINAALRDWKEPRHEEFSGKNMWGWYNAVNESLKTSTADTMLTRHASLHRFALTQVDPMQLQTARSAHIIDAVAP